MEKIDYVVTYVDSSDPEWLETFEKYSTNSVVDFSKLEERFRSWDNLKYNLRGVQDNLPFIGNVFLVVSSESQVPEWVNRNKVKVVLHKDFIPEEYLPTFCSTTIEMFLGFIPGISERFIYANDDTFVSSKCEETDFFVDGRPVLNYSLTNTQYDVRNSEYEAQLQNSFLLAKKASGSHINFSRIMPKHMVNPLTRSSYIEVWEKCGEEIKRKIGRFRTRECYNQYLFSFYDLIKKKSVKNPKTTSVYISFEHGITRAAVERIKQNRSKLLCINDSGVTDFEKTKVEVNHALDSLFPVPSLYEKPSNKGKNLTVHLYTLCYNEIKILPFAVEYWKTIADEVFVLDNNSTDGSKEYLSKIPNVHIVEFSSDGFNDDIHRRLKNEVWKASRGKADFVVVCDLDEFMYSPNGIRNELEKMKARGETICKPFGYNMVSEAFPIEGKGLMWEQIPNGFPDKTFRKVTIFNPNAIKDIKYSAGAHNCSPIGSIQWYTGNSVFLLHYKFLSLEYVLGRYKEYNDRLSKINKEKKWGVQYTRDRNRTISTFENNLAKSKKLECLK